jgi:PilZ domain/PAS domain
MLFGPTSIQSVRSTNQRELLAQWQRASASRLFPEITDFAPPERELKQLILWNVEDDGTTRRFRMRRQGERLTETVATNFTGKTLDEVVPEPLRTPALAAAHECVEARCAVYSIITTIDANAHVVECERLLLPFGRDGVVEHFIAALQLISYQGTVDRSTVAHEFETRCEMTFAGVIPASARDGAEVMLPPRYAAEQPGPVTVVAETPASGGTDERGEKRHNRRRAVRKTGRINARGVSEICTVRDISATGAALDVVNAKRVPDHFTLVMEMESAARDCAVIWRKERQLGVEFR